MNTGIDLRLINEGVQEVQSSEHGHLSLETRGRVWASLGPTTPPDLTDPTLESLESGHRRRFELLTVIADHVVLPAWRSESAFWRAHLEPQRGPLCADSDSPSVVAALAQSRELTSAKVAARGARYANFRQYAYEIWDDAPRAVLCIEFVAGMLSVRVRDLAVGPDDYEIGNDRWKPDVYACWAYAGSTHLYAQDRPVTADDLRARREFWRWYLLVAVPLAAGVEPLATLKLAEREWPRS